MRKEILHNLSFDEYQSCHGLNPSLAVRGVKSPKHLRHAMHDRGGKPTAYMRTGAMAHAILLEKHGERFVVHDGRFDTRIKAYRDVVIANPDKEIIKPAEFNDAKAAADAIRNDPIAMHSLEGCNHDVSVFCELNGVQCKGRLDACRPGAIRDIKLTRCCEKYIFGTSFARRHDAFRLAMYAWMWEEVTGVPVEDVELITVESSAPHDVCVVPVPQDVIDQARPLVERVVEAYQDGLERNHWPGVAAGARYELHVPEWALAESEHAWT